jgi:hypothetical protein
LLVVAVAAKAAASEQAEALVALEQATYLVFQREQHLLSLLELVAAMPLQAMIHQ